MTSRRTVIVFALAAFFMAVPEVRGATFLRVHTVSKTLSATPQIVSASQQHVNPTDNLRAHTVSKTLSTSAPFANTSQQHVNATASTQGDKKAEEAEDVVPDDMFDVAFHTTDPFESELIGQVDEAEEDEEAERGVQCEEKEHEPLQQVDPPARQETQVQKPRGVYNYITGEFHPQPAALIQTDRKDVDEDALEDLDEDDAKVARGESESDDVQDSSDASGEESVDEDAEEDTVEDDSGETEGSVYEASLIQKIEKNSDDSDDAGTSESSDEDDAKSVSGEAEIDDADAHEHDQAEGEEDDDQTTQEEDFADEDAHYRDEARTADADADVVEDDSDESDAGADETTELNEESA